SLNLTLSYNNHFFTVPLYNHPGVYLICNLVQTKAEPHMNVKNIHFNPFALSTAKSAWNNPKSSLASRVCKSVAGAVYDIYVKNPYDLTVGNCKSLYNSPEAHSTKQKVA